MNDFYINWVEISGQIWRERTSWRFYVTISVTNRYTLFSTLLSNSMNSFFHSVFFSFCFPFISSVPPQYHCLFVPLFISMFLFTSQPSFQPPNTSFLGKATGSYSDIFLRVYHDSSQIIKKRNSWFSFYFHSFNLMLLYIYRTFSSWFVLTAFFLQVSHCEACLVPGYPCRKHFPIVLTGYAQKQTFTPATKACKTAISSRATVEKYEELQYLYSDRVSHYIWMDRLANIPAFGLNELSFLWAIKHKLRS